MSRVADALERAGTAGESAGGGNAVAPMPQGNLDIAAIAVPWDVEQESQSSVEEPAPVAPRRIEAVAPVQRQTGGDFVELVQRIFRPGSDEPMARCVTFVGVGVVGVQRPIAFEVAQTLAAHGVGTVCIVDASFGSARLHETAGTAAGPGLCDALLSSRPVASLAVQVGRHLWVVPAGEEMSTSAEWMPDALARAVRQLASKFDFVLVEAPRMRDQDDLPPLLCLAPLTDGVVLVLESERTRRDVASDVAVRLRATGVPLFGAVLANRSSDHGRR